MGIKREPFCGIDIPPFWSVVPPSAPSHGQRVRIAIEEGSAFGNGEHETTRLCLQAIAVFAPSVQLPDGGRAGFRLLDFGSGSGVLSIGAAKLGAMAEGIEIDEGALREAERNARLNGVEDRVRWARTLEGALGPYEMVVANILRSVLLTFASELVHRLAPQGTLILSGLVSTDVPEIIGRYAPLLGGRRPEIYERGEWRALVWRG